MSPQNNPQAITVYHHGSESIYSWPTVVFWWVIYALLSLDWISAQSAGWLFYATLWLWMFIFQRNISLMGLIFAIVFFGLVGMSLLAMQLGWQWPIFEAILIGFRNLDLSVSPDIILIAGSLQGMLVLYSLIADWLTGECKIGTNDLELQLGVFDQENLSTKDFDFKFFFDDIFLALITLGAGDIHLIDKNNGTIRKIENVAFLFFRKDRINDIRNRTTVTVTNP